MENNEPATAEERRSTPAARRSFFDRFNTVTISCAVVLSLLILATGWREYRKQADYARYVPIIRKTKISDDEARFQLTYLKKYNPPGHESYKARLHYQLGEYEMALREAQAELIRQPGNAELETIVGKSFFSLNQFDQARQHLQAALRTQPGHPEASFYMGRLAFDSGNLREASTHLGFAAMDPDYNSKADPLRQQIMTEFLGEVEPITTTTLAMIPAEAPAPASDPPTGVTTNSQTSPAQNTAVTTATPGT